MSARPADTAKLDELAQDVERVMDRFTPEHVLGADLSNLVARIPGDDQVTPSAVIRLALLNDLLRIAEQVILADGMLSTDELEYVDPLAREAQKYLGRFRRFYRDAFDGDVPQFLKQHANDRQKFGGKCGSTQWAGAELCRRASELARDSRLVDDYRNVVVNALDELFDGNGRSDDAKAKVIAELSKFLPKVAKHADPRDVAYCSKTSPEVFHAVAHPSDVFNFDHFDVDEIHGEARVVFRRLLARATEGKFGRMLLIKGDSGSGKTHLMRAFRNLVHGEQLGFVSYLQMSADVANYSRYILSNTLKSWERAFDHQVQDSALACLSDSVARNLLLEDQESLRNDDSVDEDVDAHVNRCADRLYSLEKFTAVDLDVLRMMLYLQRREPARRSRVLKFLRCEQLSTYDQKFVGGVQSFDAQEGPARMLAELGKLVAITGNGAMVLLVDQVEDMFSADDAGIRFRAAMDALRAVTDQVSSSVIVIACLEDYYTKMRGALSKPVLDRLERDPEPVQLTSGRTLSEIEEMLRVRLSHLYEQKGARIREEEPFYPFRHEHLSARANQRTRDVLDWAGRHHEASILAGRIVEPPVGVAPHPVDPAPTVTLAQAWNAHVAMAALPPDDEASRMKLLAASLERAGRELEPVESLTAMPDESFVDTTLGSAVVVVGLCDKSAKGSGLTLQVDALAKRAKAKNAVAVVLRGADYPKPGATKVAQRLADIIKSGGRKLIVRDDDWRAMHALKEFEDIHGKDPRYAEWVRTDRPLHGVDVIRTVLEFRAPSSAGKQPVSTPQPQPAAATPPSTPSMPPAPPAANRRAPTNDTFIIGDTRGLAPQPISVSSSAFVTHAAFLGSSGSGKTTLALGILEHLMMHGTPVVMIDRKGDLCRYASPDFWDAVETDPKVADAKAALRDAVEVRVYTPGDPRGRNLSLSVVPAGLRELPAHDRGIISRYAASALGTMMGYKKTAKDETKLGILGKTIELVGGLAGTAEVGLDHLVEALDAEDPELVSLVGKLDTKHFHALVENLATLRLRNEHVLRNDGERLSPDLLFGFDEPERTKARLSIISTKFLGDNAAVDFWVARLLGELARWASQRPSSTLQAAIFLDEADLYLPATSKPATKEPMMDLLRRARSAGLGVFLATQSPGDLDYKCRDNISSWFVGRVAEKNSVDKMKPLLSECRINITGKLAGAKVGEFFKLQQGQVTEFKAAQSICKTVQVPEDEILRLARGRKE